jgi:hypothetical protein
MIAVSAHKAARSGRKCAQLMITAGDAALRFVTP